MWMLNQHIKGNFYFSRTESIIYKHCFGNIHILFSALVLYKCQLKGFDFYTYSKLSVNFYDRKYIGGLLTTMC